MLAIQQEIRSKKILQGFSLRSFGAQVTILDDLESSLKRKRKGARELRSRHRKHRERSLYRSSEAIPMPQFVWDPKVFYTAGWLSRGLTSAKVSEYHFPRLQTLVQQGLSS